MKIAVVSEGWEPVYGGGQVHVEFLCSYLVRDHSAEVDLFTRQLVDEKGRPYTTNESRENGKRRILRVGPVGKYFDMWKRILCLWSITYALYKESKKKRYDIIHAHALLAGIPAWIVGKILSIPVVYTVHGSIHLDSGRKNIYYYVEQFLICKLVYSAEIFVSHVTLDYANKNKYRTVIHNGVDIERFAFQTKTPHQGMYMVTVGRVDRQKNHVAVIHALSKIDKQLLDKVQFQRLVVGDGPLLEDCKKQVHSLGLSKYVQFMGKIFGQQLVDIYHTADVFILPSLAEGQPLTVLEAYASGIPVIATDVGDNKYIIQNEYNGILVPVNNDISLQHAIEFCINPLHSDICKNRGENGKKLVEESYNWHNIIAKTYDVYKDINRQ